MADETRQNERQLIAANERLAKKNEELVALNEALEQELQDIRRAHAELNSRHAHLLMGQELSEQELFIIKTKNLSSFLRPQGFARLFVGS